MSAFIQNHPGEQALRPRPRPGGEQSWSLFFLSILLVGVPVAIAIGTLNRLKAIGKVDGWPVYAVPAVLFLAGTALLIAIARRLMLKSVAEQKKYYRLAGNAGWLPSEKREALQLEANYCYQAGSWVETLEYWPSEVRLSRMVRFSTFQLATTEDRLAGNDQAWGVLSERSYTERVDMLFAGMHSRLFAADRQVMTPQNRDAMTARMAELTQLPERYIRACWEPAGSKPAQLVWAFDLQRVVELSRTSFMAGIISEQMAWEQILKASAYAHALFNNLDDFFNNYRLGHAYWSNDFRKTNELAQMHKNYNNDCRWPIKDVPWTHKDVDSLPEVIRSGCKEYVEEEVRRNTRQSIGFQSPGNGSG